MKRLQITTVDPGVAFDAGLRRSDILDTYNGVALDSLEALSDAMSSHVGQTHSLQFIRANKFLNVDIPAGPLGIAIGVTDLDLDYLKSIHDMQISTTPYIPGYKITKSIDVITAECVFGMNIFKDIFFDTIIDYNFNIYEI